MGIPNRLRYSTAVLSAFAALIVAGALTLASERAYVTADLRVDQSITAMTNGVAEQPSTTAQQASNGGNPAAARERDALAKLKDARAASRRQLETTERAVLAFAAIAAAFAALSAAIVVRAARTERSLRDHIAGCTNHDGLTALPNERFFGEWLTYAIAHARRERGHVGVLFIDVNGCAAVTECHGEADRDTLLIEVARRFRAVSREGDMLARVGPTAFALATTNAQEGRELALLAQRLRDQLNESSQPPLADTPIGASIGIAYFPEDANDCAGMMAAANVAMYAARKAGRNHVAFNALAA
ncbi:MAG: GGDEF domain-containing protein [Betaproteobacteria bacterium]